MIKTVLRIFIIWFFVSVSAVFAEPLKITDLIFDKSDNVIFLTTEGAQTNPVVKKGILTSPERIFFDIENAVLTGKRASFDFKYGKLTNLRISQFSSNPAVVRIVMTYGKNLDTDKIRVLSLGGNLIIKLSDAVPSQDFMTPIYREVKSSAYDYFEKVNIYASDIILPAEPVTLAPKVKPGDITLGAIDKAVNNTATGVMLPSTEPIRVNPPITDMKLTTRYYLEDAALRAGNILLRGTGIVNLEKVFYLESPSRVVFDLPNAVCNPMLRNKEIKINETESFKTGQFEPTKVRIVITTPEPQKYRAVYSEDLQNLLLAHEDRLTNVKLFRNTSKLTNITAESRNELRNLVSQITLNFSAPIVHSLKRNDKSLELKIYNAAAESLSVITKQLKGSGIKNILADRLGTNGIIIQIPIRESTTAGCLENLSADKLILSIKSPVVPTIGKKNLSGKVIILDPGHGGSDPGAVSNNIEEKKLTLEIAKLTEKKLLEQGAVVYMTRTTDEFVSLQERVEFSAKHSPVLFISIHINSSEKEGIHGIETHYWKEDSPELAKSVHKSLIEKIDYAHNRGLFKSRFYVVRNTNVPSILVELGYISNNDERNKLLTEERQEKSAEAISEGIINFIRSEK